MLVRSGMTEGPIAKSRQRLERFLLDLLEPIGRSERRHWGELYVRGLLQDGERKSIEPMAARLPDGNVQAMQQFVGQSPWAWEEVWARLGKRMTAELEPDSAWVVDDTGFPKQGEDSVGVDRQYSGTLGKTGNCQVAVSLHHVGEQGNAVLGWRLYLPETWTQDIERRQAAGVPEEVVFKKKWELALDLIDQVRAWAVPDRIVLADAGYGEATEFRDALEERGLRYAVGIAPQVGVWTKAPKIKVAEYRGRGAPPKKGDYGEQRPSSVKDVALKAKGWKRFVGGKGRRAGWSHDSWRCGCNPPTVSSTGIRHTRRPGCWWSGPRKKRSRPNTSSATCRRATPCAGWCASPNAGGRSNKTTTNSRKSWVWIITKEEAGMGGTIM